MLAKVKNAYGRIGIFHFRFLTQKVFSKFYYRSYNELYEIISFLFNHYNYEIIIKMKLFNHLNVDV